MSLTRQHSGTNTPAFSCIRAGAGIPQPAGSRGGVTAKALESSAPCFTNHTAAPRLGTPQLLGLQFWKILRTGQTVKTRYQSFYSLLSRVRSKQFQSFQSHFLASLPYDMHEGSPCTLLPGYWTSNSGCGLVHLILSDLTHVYSPNDSLFTQMYCPVTSVTWNYWLSLQPEL